MCHNDMEQIQREKNVGLLGSVVGGYFRWFFRKVKVAEKMTFILLSEDMCSYFRSFCSDRNIYRIQWIDHCYLRPSVDNGKLGKTVSTKLNIGIPGFLSENRGLPQLRLLLSMIVNDQITINAISRLSSQVSDRHFRALNQGNRLLPYNEYSKLAEQMDAMLLLYSVDSYRLTASGAVLDAIWNEKPIFALENYYFKYLFQKFGAMGQLFTDVESLAAYLNQISSEELKVYSRNLKSAKTQLLPSNIKLQLERVIAAQING